MVHFTLLDTMRYKIVYQQGPLITIYRYCSYMMQVGAILRVWVPDISKCRVEVLGADDKYYLITTVYGEGVE